MNPWGDDIQGIPARVTFTPEGHRDVMWCTYLNEPIILEWREAGTAPWCAGCKGTFELETHPFICHIEKRSLGAMGRPIFIHRDEAEFIDDACLADGSTQWHALQDQVRERFGMSPMRREQPLD